MQELLLRPLSSCLSSVREFPSNLCNHMFVLRKEHKSYKIYCCKRILRDISIHFIISRILCRVVPLHIFILIFHLFTLKNVFVEISALWKILQFVVKLTKILLKRKNSVWGKLGWRYKHKINETNMKIRNIFHIRYYKNFYGSHLKDRNRNYWRTET